MSDPCSCPPGACHGGHTIDVGPSWVCLTDERLRQLRDDPNMCTTTAERSMAAELLAARARITELEGGHHPATEPLGYLPAVTYGDGGRRLAPSAHLTVSDGPVPGGVVAWALGPPEPPGKLIGHAVLVNAGTGWFADTVNLDGSHEAAERRYHNWLADSGYQAIVVELREVTEP